MNSFDNFVIWTDAKSNFNNLLKNKTVSIKKENLDAGLSLVTVLVSVALIVGLVVGLEDYPASPP